MDSRAARHDSPSCCPRVRLTSADLVPGHSRPINSPNLMWQADQAWFVASEIDQPWTGFAGDIALADELVAHPALDVELIARSERPPYWRE